MIWSIQSHSPAKVSFYFQFVVVLFGGGAPFPLFQVFKLHRDIIEAPLNFVKTP